MVDRVENITNVSYVYNRWQKILRLPHLNEQFMDLYCT